VLFAPINQTGTYSLLVHSTLFDGKDTTEPITLAAKFTTITPDNMPPEILFDIPKFLTAENKILPKIIEDNLSNVTYILDGLEIEIPAGGFNTSDISSGEHVLTVHANDRVGHETTKSFTFIVDNEPPLLEIKSPKNNTSVSNKLFIDLKLSDDNLPDKEKISFLLPTGERIVDKTTYSFDTTDVKDGEYKITIFGIDKAENSVSRDIMFLVDHSIVDKPKSSQEMEFDPFLIIIISGIAIAIIVSIAFSQKKRRIASNQ
jgi:hypothetical protein